MSAVRLLAPAFLLLALMATSSETSRRRGTSSATASHDLLQAASYRDPRRADKNDKDDDEDRKTLSQQVAEGKYGLIQKELFSGRSRRPGVLSYKSNPEVPRDSAATLGGLQAEEIWLAEDHLLVLRGGSLKDDGDSGGRTPSAPPWPPIDSYQAPPRQVKLPARPAVAPPFPVRLKDGGPAVFLRSANGSSPQIVTGGFVPLVPWNGTLLVAAGTNLSALTGLPTLPVPALPVPGNAAAGSAPFLPVPFPLSNASIVGDPPSPHWLQSLPPGAAFLPPPPPNLTEPYDEDDPSIYYPPPYDFYYPKDNSSAVAAGPLVPGIILPPPPDFFGPLEPEQPVVPMTTTTTTTTTTPPTTTTRVSLIPVRIRRPPSTFVRPSPPLQTDNEVDAPPTSSPRPPIGYEYRKPKQNVYQRLKLGQQVKVADNSFDEATTTERTVIIGGPRRTTTQRPTSPPPTHQVFLVRPRPRPTLPPSTRQPLPSLPPTPDPYYSDNLVSPPPPDSHAIFQFDFRSQRQQRPLVQQPEPSSRQSYRGYQQQYEPSPKLPARYEDVTQAPQYFEEVPIEPAAPKPPPSPAPRPFSALRPFSPQINPYQYPKSTTPAPAPLQYEPEQSVEITPAPAIQEYHETVTLRRPIPTSSPTYRPAPTSSPTYRPVATSSPTYRPVPTSSPTYRPVPTSSPTYRPGPTSSPTYRPVPTSSPTYRPGPTSSPTYRQHPLQSTVTSTPVPPVHYYETSSPQDKATFYFYEEPVLTTTSRPPAVVNDTHFYEYFPVSVSSTTAAPGGVPSYLYNNAYRNPPPPPLSPPRHPIKSALTYFNGDAPQNVGPSSPRAPVYEFSFQAQSVTTPPQLQGGFQPSIVRPAGNVYNSLPPPPQQHVHTAPPPVYTTSNPLYYYTQHDDSVFDDITKKYFSMFGRKLPSDDKPRATTPLPPLTTTEQSQPPSPYSLATDTQVNYRRPLPDVDAESEPIRSVGGSGVPGGNAFISYRLPGSGGHFYFLTPQLGPGRPGRRLTVIAAR